MSKPRRNVEGSASALSQWAREEAVAVRLKAYIDNDAPDFMFQARRSFPRRLLGYFGTPAAKGTGVLINHGELQGILTCAHVDKRLRD